MLASKVHDMRIDPTTLLKQIGVWICVAIFVGSACYADLLLALALSKPPSFIADGLHVFLIFPYLLSTLFLILITMIGCFVDLKEKCYEKKPRKTAYDTFRATSVTSEAKCSNQPTVTPSLQPYGIPTLEEVSKMD